MRIALFIFLTVSIVLPGQMHSAKNISLTQKKGEEFGVGMGNGLDAALKPSIAYLGSTFGGNIQELQRVFVGSDPQTGEPLDKPVLDTLQENLNSNISYLEGSMSRIFSARTAYAMGGAVVSLAAAWQAWQYAHMYWYPKAKEVVDKQVNKLRARNYTLTAVGMAALTALFALS